MANEFRLDGIVPWGREAEEYELFLALEDLPSSARVLDCGGGPASFTAEWSGRGRVVRAADPIYGLGDGRLPVALPQVLESLEQAAVEQGPVIGHGDQMLGSGHRSCRTQAL
jgi:hypothetical protein